MGIHAFVDDLLRAQVPAEPASLPQIRHAAAAALTAIGITDNELLRAVELALSEAVTNAVTHAYPHAAGHIDCSMRRGDGEIIVTVADAGVGIDNAAASSGLGLGMHVIDRLATAREIDSDSAGTTVTMHFATSPVPPDAS